MTAAAGAAVAPDCTMHTIAHLAFTNEARVRLLPPMNRTENCEFLSSPSDGMFHAVCAASHGAIKYGAINGAFPHYLVTVAIQVDNLAKLQLGEKTQASQQPQVRQLAMHKFSCCVPMPPPP